MFSSFFFPFCGHSEDDKNKNKNLLKNTSTDSNQGSTVYTFNSLDNGSEGAVPMSPLMDASLVSALRQQDRSHLINSTNNASGNNSNASNSPNNHESLSFSSSDDIRITDIADAQKSPPELNIFDQQNEKQTSSAMPKDGSTNVDKDDVNTQEVAPFLAQFPWPSPKMQLKVLKMEITTQTQKEISSLSQQQREALLQHIQEIFMIFIEDFKNNTVIQANLQFNVHGYPLVEKYLSQINALFSSLKQRDPNANYGIEECAAQLILYFQDYFQDNEYLIRDIISTLCSLAFIYRARIVLIKSVYYLQIRDDVSAAKSSNSLTLELKSVLQDTTDSPVPPSSASFSRRRLSSTVSATGMNINNNGNNIVATADGDNVNLAKLHVLLEPLRPLCLLESSLLFKLLAARHAIRSLWPTNAVVHIIFLKSQFKSLTTVINNLTLPDVNYSDHYCILSESKKRLEFLSNCYHATKVYYLACFSTPPMELSQSIDILAPSKTMLGISEKSLALYTNLLESQKPLGFEFKGNLILGIFMVATSKPGMSTVFTDIFVQKKQVTSRLIKPNIIFHEADSQQILSTPVISESNADVSMISSSGSTSENDTNATNTTNEKKATSVITYLKFFPSSLTYNSIMESYPIAALTDIIEKVRHVINNLDDQGGSTSDFKYLREGDVIVIEMLFERKETLYAMPIDEALTLLVFVPKYTRTFNESKQIITAYLQEVRDLLRLGGANAKHKVMKRKQGPSDKGNVISPKT